MPLHIKNGGAWLATKALYRNVAGVWKRAAVHRNVAGTWRQALASITPINLTISASANNVNLFTLAGSPAGIVALTVTINAGVVVGSTSTASPALTTGSGWAAGSTITIVNNGTVEGMGGAGGAGAPGTADANGAAGQIGGDALQLLWPVSVNNSNGNIWGGGGGGGASASAAGGVPGGGGGGGAGVSGGSGGASGGLTTGGYNRRNAQAGTGGTQTSGGTGGLGGYFDMGSGNPTNFSSDRAGAGGAPGQAGAVGGASFYDEWMWDDFDMIWIPGSKTQLASGGAGGPAGYAVRQNGNGITWLAGLNGTQVKGTVG